MRSGNFSFTKNAKSIYSQFSVLITFHLLGCASDIMMACLLQRRYSRKTEYPVSHDVAIENVEGDDVRELELTLQTNLHDRAPKEMNLISIQPTFK